MFITPAYAQAAAPAAAGGFDFMSMLPLVAIVVIFYFLLIRPQQQQVKKHKELVANIRRNDMVVTQGGILGKVTKVKEGDAEIEVEIAPNVRVTVLRHTITDVRVKGEPAKEA